MLASNEVKIFGEKLLVLTEGNRNPIAFRITHEAKDYGPNLIWARALLYSINID